MKTQFYKKKLDNGLKESAKLNINHSVKSQISLTRQQLIDSEFQAKESAQKRQDLNSLEQNKLELCKEEDERQEEENEVDEWKNITSFNPYKN